MTKSQPKIQNLKSKIENPLDWHIYRPETPRRGAAILAMFLAGGLFGLMGLCTKAAGMPLAGRRLPAAEITLFRFAFGVIVLLPLLRKPEVALLGHDRRGLVLRGIFGGVAVYAFFLSLHYTLLTHAVLLNYSSVIFAPIVAALVLHERIGKRAALAISMAVVGMLLVTEPRAGGAHIGDLFGLIGGVVSALAVTTIRQLRRTETSLSIVFYLSLVGVPISLIGCLFQPPAWPTSVGWLLLLGMGASSVAGQTLMTYGYKYVTTTEGVLLTLSQVVYGAIFAALWFHEPLTPGTLFGGMLVLAAALWLSAIEQRKMTRSAT